jgi:hypothetical protein
MVSLTVTGWPLWPRRRTVSAPLVRSQDLQVDKRRHPGEVPADRLVGVGFEAQVHVAGRVVLEPGHQQDPPPARRLASWSENQRRWPKTATRAGRSATDPGRISSPPATVIGAG